MAVYDATMPILVTVFCDECGVEESHDYLVPAGVDSLFVARNHLKTNAGWFVSAFEDLCPDCKDGESEEVIPAG